MVTQSQQVRRSIGYVSQAGGVSSYARAGDEVVDRGMLHGLSRVDATARGQELFEQLDLPGLWAARPSRCPVGRSAASTS